MTKSQLKVLKKEELLDEAKKLGLKVAAHLRKDELVEWIIEALENNRAGLNHRKRSNMDPKESPKKQSLLKSVVASVPPSTRPPTTYARKPASNIQRHKTTQKKIQKVVSASQEKREADKPKVPHLQSRAETPPTPESPPAPPANPASDMVAHKFDIEPHRQPVDTSRFDHLGELPESYDSGTLFLVARDPHWLFAYWDFSWHKMAEFRGRASDNTVRLHIYKVDGAHAQLQQDIVLHSDAKNWFIHVGQSKSQFRAEFGYYTQDGFHAISRSPTIKTPSDDLSNNTSARFATLPFHIKFHELVEFVKTHFRPGDELMDVLYRLQARGFRLPFDYEGVELDAEHEADLLQLFGEDLYRRIQMGSFEISEWLRKRFREEALGGVSSWSSPSSPFGGSWQRSYRNFWLNVNADIILYGETDPHAKVCVDGKEIKLRPDGSFRFHFALPDGKFHLPIRAESADHLEVRSAVIDFSRSTGVEGDVGESTRSSNLPQPLKA